MAGARIPNNLSLERANVYSKGSQPQANQQWIAIGTAPGFPHSKQIAKPVCQQDD